MKKLSDVSMPRWPAYLLAAGAAACAVPAMTMPHPKAVAQQARSAPSSKGSFQNAAVIPRLRKSPR